MNMNVLKYTATAVGRTLIQVCALVGLLIRSVLLYVHVLLMEG